MTTSFIILLFTATGSFLIWCTKGFKGSFNNVMVSVNERQTYKGRMRLFLGMAVWAVLLLIVSSMLATPEEETKTYKARVNEPLQVGYLSGTWLAANRRAEAVAPYDYSHGGIESTRC